ncbi:MAG: aspartate/glutamate racemase family protein [Pseudomonadota bacterium]|nr:aspartate/glutamate racemase family protein [Pseudomonadota bacterium]
MTTHSFHIRLITPNADPALDISEEIAVYRKRYTPLLPGLVISHRVIDNGPVSIQTAEDTRQAAPFVVKKVIEAEREGVDAVIIDCFSQPGLGDARKAVKIPVVGAGEAAMNAAARLTSDTSRIAQVYTLDEARTAIDRGATVIVVASTGKTGLADEIRHKTGTWTIDPLPEAFQKIIDGFRNSQRIEQRPDRNVSSAGSTSKTERKT